MEPLRTTRYRNYIKLLTTLLTQREDIRMYINLLLTVIAIAFFSWFAIRPTLITILELQTTIFQQKETLKKLEQKAQQLQEVQQVVTTLSQDTIRVNQAIPDTAAPHIFARQIETLAILNGVTLSSLSVGKITLVGKDESESRIASVLPDQTTAFPISLTSEGEPEKVLLFLASLSQMRQPIIWEGVSVLGKPPGSATTIGLSVNGYLPVYKEALHP